MDKLDHLGWVESRSYEFGHAQFGIRTTSNAFAKWMDRTLGAYRIDDEVFPYYSIVVPEADESKPRSVKDFHILYRGTSAFLRTLHLPTLARMLMADIETFLYADRDDSIYAAMTPISSNGATALAPSQVVSFLGGLGRRVRRAGLSLPAATALAVDPQTGRVSAPPRLLDVPADALDRLGQIGPDNGEADLDEIDGEVTVDIVLTQTNAGQQVVLQPVSRAQALQALTASVINLETIGGAALDGLARVVSGSPCYSLSGTAEDVLDAVKTTLRSG